MLGKPGGRPPDLAGTTPSLVDRYKAQLRRDTAKRNLLVNPQNIQHPVLKTLCSSVDEGFSSFTERRSV